MCVVSPVVKYRDSLVVFFLVAVCTIQSDITIGDLSITVGSGGSSVSFSCPDNFRLVGNETQSCVGFDLSTIDVSCIKGVTVLHWIRTHNFQCLSFPIVQFAQGSVALEMAR